MKKYLVIGALLLSGVALAQVPGAQVITSPTGSEYFPVVSNTISSVVQLNTMRNTSGYKISSATSGTITTTTATNFLLLTGAVGTATVDVPPKPADGQVFTITNASGSAFTGTITVASTDSSSFAPTSPTIVNMAASSSEKWVYTAAATTWYRVQ